MRNTIFPNKQKKLFPFPPSGNYSFNLKRRIKVFLPRSTTRKNSQDVLLFSKHKFIKGKVSPDNNKIRPKSGIMGQIGYQPRSW